MTPAADPVIRALIALNLTEHEADFRTVLAGRLTKQPVDTRILSIAAVAILMQLGRVPWPYIQQSVTHLEALPGETLRNEAVAIINGTHLVIPTISGIIVVQLSNGATTTDPPPAIVSTIYGVNVIWELVAKALATK